MAYAELAYFDGNHCAHCAAFAEQRRLARIEQHLRKVHADRRRYRNHRVNH